MEDREIDLRLREVFRRNEPSFEQSEVDTVNQAASLRHVAGGGRRSPLRLATVTVAVLVVGIGVAAGVWQAIAHLGSNSPIVLITDQTTSPPLTNTAVDETTAVTSKEPTVIKNNSTAAFIHIYRTVDELIASNQADLIIKGQVVGYKDVYWHSWALRALQVEVQKRFKGESASTITVYEEGAVIPLKDVIPDLGAHFDPSALSEQQIENTVVDFTFEGAAHSKVGDNDILFLYNNPNKISEGVSYLQLMSVFGRFTLDTATGEYNRPNMSGTPGFETQESSTSIEAKLAR